MAGDGTLYSLHGALALSRKRILVVARGYNLGVLQLGDGHTTLEITVDDL